METINLIFIGEDFIVNHDSIMSSIYVESDGAYHRWDWRMVQFHLSNGSKIKIRPATQKELKYFNEKLEILSRNHIKK